MCNTAPAMQVKAAENAWNTRDPSIVCMAYTPGEEAASSDDVSMHYPVHVMISYLSRLQNLSGAIAQTFWKEGQLSAQTSAAIELQLSLQKVGVGCVYA